MVESFYASILRQILLLDEHRDAELAGSVEHCFLGLVEKLELVLEADQANATVAFLFGVCAAGSGSTWRAVLFSFAREIEGVCYIVWVYINLGTFYWALYVASTVLQKQFEFCLEIRIDFERDFTLSTFFQKLSDNCMTQVSLVYDIVALEFDDCPHCLISVDRILQPTKRIHLFPQNPLKLLRLIRIQTRTPKPILNLTTEPPPPILKHLLQLPSNFMSLLIHPLLPALPFLLQPLYLLQIGLDYTTAALELCGHFLQQMVDLLVGGAGALGGVLGCVDLYAGGAQWEQAVGWVRRELPWVQKFVRVQVEWKTQGRRGNISTVAI